MSPELLNAVKERVNLGQNDDQIREELRQSGYDDDTISAVLAQAKEAPSDVPAASGAVALPGVFNLIDSSFKYAFSRVDLWLLLAAPTLVAIVLDYLMRGNESSVFSALAILIMLVNIVFALAAVYVVGISSQRKASLVEGIQWIKSNGFSLIWVGIISGLAAFGGFALFLIPGVIISVYLMLSYYALVREGHKGMDALMRSRELVYGNWLTVAGRLLGVGIFFIVIFFILSFVFGFVTQFSNEMVEMVVTLLFGLVQIFFNLVGMRISVSIYDSLLAARPNYQPEQHASARKKYKILAWWGILGFVLMIGFVVLVITTMTF